MSALTFTRSTTLPVSAAEAFAWHERPGALERLIPPWERIDVQARSGGIRDGGRVILKHRAGPAELLMEAEHFGYIEGQEFRDRMVRGPFSRWEHRHLFRDHPETGSCVLTDAIDYDLMGRPWSGEMVRAQLQRMFTYRHAVTGNDLALWKRWADKPRLRVLVSGASGLVGSTLCPLLTTQGHEVLRLVRHTPGNPGEVDLDHLEGAGRIDAVVHLAGENVAGGRWTEERRRRILQSREEGTRRLVEALGRVAEAPQTFVSASAVGFYGSRGDSVCLEGDGPGDGFLSQVCQAWEREAQGARALNMRVVSLRIGVVLSPAGGALEKLLPLFQIGLGGPIGDGQMWMSWIGIDDLASIIVHALMDGSLSGPVNAVAPEPVRNAEFAKELGEALSRPALVRVPALALRAMYGEMAEETLLASTRVQPMRLQTAGFGFRQARIREAFRHVLGTS